MSHRRGPALLCLLLATVLTVFAAPHLASAGPPAEPAPPQSLNDENIYYEETPAVQIIPLTDLEPVDTLAATNPFWIEGGTLDPVDPAEMETILAECTLEDNTIVRLYATAEGLIDGAFSRPDQGWIRFVRCYNGEGNPSAFVANPTLTPFDGVMGKSGFLLRSSTALDYYSHDYYWFDEDGTLRMLHAWFDPVALDLDGDGTTELVWEIAEWTTSLSFYCQEADGTVYEVQTGVYIGGFLEAVEAEGPGPVRLIFRRYDSEAGLWQYHALTLRDGALEVERDIAYVPATLEDAISLPDPTAGRTALPHVSITGPDGWTMDGAGAATYFDLHSQLWDSPFPSPNGTVIVPTDAPLDEETAYTVTFSDPETGDSFSWSLDAEGVCRFDGIEGNCRLVATSAGSLPAYCYNVLAIYCQASRTAQNYDDQGRWLGWDLVEDWTPIQ